MEYAELERGRQELERVWDEMERQRRGPLTEELGAQAAHGWNTKGTA